MKKTIVIILIMFGFFNNVSANYTELAHNFEFKSIDGNTIKLKQYKDKVIVVVNVASRCGFTNQYKDLQKLWLAYEKENLVVLGIPTNNFKQEPGSNSDIKDFCETNFNITFPMSEKTDVIGKNSHPFYRWAKENYGNAAIPKWNFHKIIIGKDGKVAETFGSITNPSSKKFINTIEKIIKN
ncbi:MAG: glutathione peroxidase [Pelagibacterales bacterium]|jgi:glutathione peroxidase|nr:glutathione peroxidase [Pelagibacterales bacterium]|tara:strand:- start:93 stop:638 length:546 start_codon:yes stop_codon:yes gene_type:complete